MDSFFEPQSIYSIPLNISDGIHQQSIDYYDPPLIPLDAIVEGPSVTNATDFTLINEANTNGAQTPQQFIEGSLLRQYSSSPSETESYDSNVDSPPAQEDEDTRSPSQTGNAPWFTLPSYRYKYKPLKKSKSEDRHEVTKQTYYIPELDVMKTPFITSSNASTVFGKLKESLDQPSKRCRFDYVRPESELKIDPLCAVDHDLQRILDRASRSQFNHMLPVQMMLHICTFLSVHELGVVSRTCLYFNSIIEEYRYDNELVLWAAIVDACGSKYLVDQEELERITRDRELKTKIMYSIQPKDWRAKFRMEDLKRELFQRGVNREAVCKLKLKTELQAKFSSILEFECCTQFIEQKKLGYDIPPDNVFFQALPPQSSSYPRNRANVVIRVVWAKDFIETKDPYVKFYTKLKEAVESARLNDVIILYKKTHVLDDKLLINKNIEIIGVGSRDSVIIKGSLLFEDCHVRLHNVTVDRTSHRTEAIHCMNAILDLDCCIVKSLSTSVLLSKGANALIKNCTIYGPSKPVIRIDWSAENVLLCNNELCTFSVRSPEDEVDESGSFAVVQVDSEDQSMECSAALIARYNTIVNGCGHAIGYKVPIGMRCIDTSTDLQCRFKIHYNHIENNLGCTEDCCVPYLPCQVTVPTVQIEDVLSDQEVGNHDDCLPLLCTDHQMTWFPILDNSCGKLLHCNSLSNQCIIGYLKQRIKFTASDRILTDCALTCKLCSNSLKLLTMREVRLLFGRCNMDIIFGTSPDVFVCEYGHISNVNASECTIS